MPPGCVAIRVEAAGLNFIDVLRAMGTYEGSGERGPVHLGGECAGVVTALGERVEGLWVGAPVVAIAGPAFASDVIAPAACVAVRPASMSAEVGASLPVAYATAILALEDAVRIRPGERVLVHTASGATGLAAVAIARAAGAEVLATAGSERKRRFLRDELGIACVGDSRSLAFVDDVRRHTGGAGVDVVFNTLAGELMERSIDLLAPDGRFVEIAKAAVWGGGALALAPFRAGLTFAMVDLAGLAQRRPERVGELLRRAVDGVASGRWAPAPLEVMPLERAEEGMRRMSRPEHIGKIVFTVDPDASITSSDVRGTWLVTGGLGGLGPSVAEWLGRRGAQKLVLMGRSGITTEDRRRTVEGIAATGAEVTVAIADVADEVAVRVALADVGPIHGIVHAAALLDDGMLEGQTEARMRAVLAPKVEGGRVLDAISREHPIAHFVLYSSVASILGAPGQGSYAAANAWLDALAVKRRGEGLSAVSIAWGPFAERGLAAQPGARDRGMRGLELDEGLRLLERILATDAARVIAVALEPARLVEVMPAAAKWPFLSGILAGVGPRTGDATLLARLDAAAPMDRADRVASWLQEQLGAVLRREPATIDTDAPLASLGIDSLLALELRNRVEAGLGQALPATMVWRFPTLSKLADHLVASRWPPEAEQVAVAAVAAEGAPGDEVADDELEARLLAEIAAAEDVLGG